MSRKGSPVNDVTSDLQEAMDEEHNPQEYQDGDEEKHDKHLLSKHQSQKNSSSNVSTTSPIGKTPLKKLSESIESTDLDQGVQDVIDLFRGKDFAEQSNIGVYVESLQTTFSQIANFIREQVGSSSLAEKIGEVEQEVELSYKTSYFEKVIERGKELLKSYDNKKDQLKIAKLHIKISKANFFIGNTQNAYEHNLIAEAILQDYDNKKNEEYKNAHVQTLLNKANINLFYQDFSSAKKHFKAVKQFIVKHNLPREMSYAEALEGEARIAGFLNDEPSDRIKRMHEIAIGLYLKYDEKNGFLHTRALNYYAHSLFLIGDFKEAIKLYKLSISVQEKISSRQSLDLAFSHNGIGYSLLRTIGSHNISALNHLVAAKNIRERLAPESLLTAQSYANLSIFSEFSSDFSQALMYANKALKMKLEILPHETHTLANSYFEIACIFVSMAEQSENADEMNEHYQSAIKNLNEAKRIRDKITPQSFELANIYNSLGKIYLAQNNLKEARSSFESAMKLCDTQRRSFYATALWGMANVCEKEKSYSQALTYIKDAYELAQTHKLWKDMIKYSEYAAYLLLEFAKESKKQSDPKIADMAFAASISLAEEYNEKSIIISDSKYSPALATKGNILLARSMQESHPQTQSDLIQRARECFRQAVQANRNNENARKNFIFLSQQLLLETKIDDEDSLSEPKNFKFRAVISQDLRKLSMQDDYVVTEIRDLESRTTNLEKMMVDLESRVNGLESRVHAFEVSQKIIGDQISDLDKKIEETKKQLEGKQEASPALLKLLKERQQADELSKTIMRFKQNPDLNDFYSAIVATIQSHYIAAQAIRSGELIWLKKKAKLEKR